MALTVESLLATAQLDDSGFTQGLSRITQGLEQYDRRAAALTARPTSITLDTSQALAQTGALTQNLVALERGVVDAVTTIIGSLTQGETSVEGFVASIRQGAVEELQRLGASAEQTAAVLRGFDRVEAINVETDRAVANIDALDNAADTLLAKLGLVRREVSTPLQLVSGGGGGAPPEPPDLTGFLAAQGQARLEGDRFIGTLDAVAAGMTRAGDGTLAYEEGLRRLQAQQDASAASAERLAGASDRVIAGMSQSGREALTAGAGARAWERGMAIIEGRTDAVTQSFGNASVGGSRLINTLGNMAVGFSGVQGPIATVASNLLVFFAQHAKLIGAGAVVLGLKVAYDFLNTAQREVREENERLVQGLLQQANQALPAVERAQRGLVASLDAEYRARRDLLSLRAIQAVVPTSFSPFVGELARRQQQAAGEAARAASQARVQGEQAVTDASVRNLQVLNQLLARGEASLDQRRTAVDLVRVLQAEEAKTNNLTEKLAIHQRILEAQRALNIAVEQENAARAFTAERFSQRVTDLTAAPALGTANVATVRETQAQMARLSAIINSQTASLAERNAAAQEFNALAFRGFAPLQEQLQLLQTQRQSRISVDTGDAVRQLAELERRIAAVGAATAGQRAQVIRFRAEISLEGIEQQIAPLRNALQEVTSLRALRDAGEVELADALGLQEAEAGVTRLRGLVDRLLATATGPEREVLLQVRTTLAQGDRESLQRQIQQVLAGAEASVRLTVDADPALTEIQRRFAVPFGIELDPTNALAQAEALAAELARQIAAATGGGAITDAPAELQQAFAQVTGQIQALMEAPVNALIQGADRAGQQLDAALSAAEAQRALLAGPADVGAGIADIAARTALVAPLVQQIENAYQGVTAQIEAGVQSTALLVQLQQQQAALAERLAAAAADQRTPLEVTQLAPLEAATQAYVQARQRFEVTGSREARRDVDAAAADMDRIRESLIGMIRSLNLEGDVARRIIEAIEAAYGKAGRAAGGLSEANKELLKTVQGIADIAGALSSVGDQLGIFSEDTQTALQDIQAVASDASDLLNSIKSGDPFGAIVSGINLAGSLGGALGIGPSEEERLANQLRRENTQALREFTVRVTTGFEGIGGAGDVSAIIGRVLGTDRGRALAERTQEGGDTGRAARAELVDLLEAQGLTFEQLQRVADEFGIDILSKGRLVGESLDQLREKIDAVIEADLRFLNTLDEQIARLDFRAAFTGADQGLDPFEKQQADFQRELDAFIATIANGDSFLTDALEGLDLSDPAAVRAAFLKILEKFEAGTLTAEDLGGLTREDLFRLFGDAKGYLEQFNEATQDATDRLGALNVPTVLRLDALRAQASVPEWRQVDTLANLGAPDLTNLGQRAAETFGLGEQSQSFDTLAQRLGDIAPLQDFLQQIATETPADLLSALETLSATIADRALPAGATTFIQGGEIIERRSETIERGPSVHIEYHGDILVQVTAQPGQSPAEIAAAVREEFERHAMNDTGQLQRAGETLGGP